MIDLKSKVLPASQLRTETRCHNSNALTRRLRRKDGPIGSLHHSRTSVDKANLVLSSAVAALAAVRNRLIALLAVLTVLQVVDELGGDATNLGGIEVLMVYGQLAHFGTV